MKRIVAAALLLTSGVTYAGMVGTGVKPLDTRAANATAWVANVSNVSVADGPSQAEQLNETRIEKLVHQKVNERRAAHGERRIEWDPVLATIADGHAEDMAERDYYSHTAPDGSGVRDRYHREGYECKVPVGGNQYLGGSENIVYTFYKEQLRTEGDDDYYSTPEELAAGIVSSWMHSQGHRENLLKSAWRREGIGVAVTMVDGEVKVYAVQNFC